MHLATESAFSEIKLMMELYAINILIVLALLVKQTVNNVFE